MHSRATLIRGGTLAFVTGATLMILLHESSHAVAGALLGYRPTQLPFTVLDRPTPSTADAAVTAITGPLFSLVTGFLGVAVDRWRRPFATHPYARLVWLWTVYASVQEGFGYFLIAGIVPAGDTAVALTAWNAPGWVWAASTLVGIAGLFVAARLFATPMAELSSSLADRRALSVWPWLVGTAVLVLLMAGYVLITPLPIAAGSVVAVLFGAVAVGVYAPMSMMFRRGQWRAAAPPALPARPVGGLVLLLALVVLNVILTRGWLWG